MSSALGPLAEAGAWALGAVWLPALAWTAVALAAEAALRLGAGAHVGLGVRRALLFALPVGVLAAALAPLLLPSGAAEALAVRPSALALPTITVGAAPEASGAGVAGAALPWAALVSGLALVAAGAAGLVRLAGLALALVRLRRADAWDAAPEAVQGAVDRAAQEAGVRRAVRAAVSREPVVPFTYGWRRPVVVVPSSLTTGAPLAADPALRLSLAHEMAHVARGDWAWGVAERAAAAAVAWHPLAGALARGLAVDRERATDAAVLAERPGARRAYADLLLSFSRLPSPALALGAARGSRALETRLLAMNAVLSPAHLRTARRLARGLGASLFAVAVAALALVALAPEPAAASGAASAAVTSPAPSAPEVTPGALAEPESPEAALPITGRVYNARGGMPLAGASVTVVGTSLGAATGPDGTFTLDGMDPGTAQVRVTAAGFRPLVVVPEVGVPLEVGLVPENHVGFMQRMEDARREMREARERAAETDPDSPEAPEIFEVVEEMPRLVGGLEGLQRSVVYPPEARAEGVEGKVFVQFVVGETGAVEEAQAVRCPDERLCEAALAAVRAARFQPGMQRGRPVKVRFTLPVDFKLPDE